MPKAESPRFAALFDELEKDRGHLGIQSYGVSVTTMEEVFLRVGSGESTEAVANRANAAKRLNSNEPPSMQAGSVAVAVAPLLPTIKSRVTGWPLRKFVFIVFPC